MLWYVVCLFLIRNIVFAVHSIRNGVWPQFESSLLQDSWWGMGILLSCSQGSKLIQPLLLMFDFLTISVN